MPGKPGSKAYRDQLRERLIERGVGGRQLVELVVTELMRCGCRPREAWRLAYELTQDEVAARFDRIRSDQGAGMRGSRICEYEKWPMGGVRPSVRSLKILASIYKTTWDRLVDIDDLTEMRAGDRQEFVHASDLHYGDSPDLRISWQSPSRQREYRGGDEPQAYQPITAEEFAMARERLTVPASGSSSEQPSGELPGEVTHFTGRDEPMAELRARVAEQTPQCTVVTIYAIDGMAGVGKTAFARHAAQELAKQHSEGTIWIDLYGHTPGMLPREPSSALEQMLLQLGVRPEAIKADLAERQDQWRHHIHARRMLIVLDNALSSNQVMPLLPDAPGCLVLITSRRKLTSLTDAYPLSLDVLAWDEAEQLFVKLIGEQRCEDRNAVRQIVAACGRLPLAIRLIAGRLRHHRGELLADIAADLADQTAALDTLVAEHLSVRAAFEWSYRLLNDDQRRAFRLLGWHPGPEITPVVIAAMAAVSSAKGRQLLRELVDHNLLDQLSATGVPAGPRYRMHDLVRLYARERADAEEPPDERAKALDRMASSYLTIAQVADRLLRPYISGSPATSTSRVTILAFADAAQARTWLTVERHNLLACVEAISPKPEAANLSTVLAAHFRDFGFWSDARRLYNQALTVCGRTGVRSSAVEALRGLGDVEWLVGEYDQAREHYTQALNLAQQIGDRFGEVLALRGLGEVERLVGQYGQAREYHTKSLALSRKLGDRIGEALALRGLGEVERLAGECLQGREYHIQALTLAQQLGYRRVEIDALWGLGQVQRLVGDYDQARKYHTNALSLARQLGDRTGEALALRALGDVEWLVGGYGQAHEHYTEALTLARQLGYRRAEADALRGLGEVERLIGQYDQAREHHTQALNLAQQIGERRAELLALRGLGEVERLVGQYDQAREHHTQALNLAQQIGDRFGGVLALWGLGEVERLIGRYGQAREYHTQALALARHLGDRRGEAEALWGLGNIASETADGGQACELWRRALEIYAALGVPFAETVRAAMRQHSC